MIDTNTDDCSATVPPAPSSLESAPHVAPVGAPALRARQLSLLGFLLLCAVSAGFICMKGSSQKTCDLKPQVTTGADTISTTRLELLCRDADKIARQLQAVRSAR